MTAPRTGRAGTFAEQERSAPPAEETGGRRALLFTLFLAVAANALSISLFVPAVAEIARTFHVTAAQATWTVTGFTLVSAISPPLLGRLGDLRGRRRFLTVVLVVSSTGLLLSLASPALPVLLIGRLLSGVGAAAIPLSFALVRTHLPESETKSAIALLSSTVGIGATVGWLLSGPVIDLFGWQWLSALPLVCCCWALLAVRWTVPPDREDPDATGSRVDVPGAVGLVLWLTSLLAAVSQIGAWGAGSPGVLGLATAGVLGCAAWTRYQLRTRQPIIDLRQQRTPGLLASNIAGLLCGYAFIAAGIIVPLVIQSPRGSSFGLGGTATDSSLVQLPTGLALTVCSGLAGRISNRLGSGPALALGCGVVGFSYLFMAFGYDQMWSIALMNTVRGAGLGLAYAAKANLAVESVADRDAGSASGVNILLRNMGTALGSQITGVLLASGVSVTAALLLPAGMMIAVAAFVILAARLERTRASRRRSFGDEERMT